MTTLQGQSYYEITDEAILSSDGEGFEINPFNANGTIISRIQVNFVLTAGLRLPNPLLTLPNLSLLKGNWNIEIIISSDGSERGISLPIYSSNYVDRFTPELTYGLDTPTAVALTGLSPNNYAGGVGILRPLQETATEPPVKTI